MINKIFRIGEYAIGGLIYARINKEDVTIACKDWNTKEVIYNKTSDSERLLTTTLLSWTSSYHTDKIMEYIAANAKGILES